MNQVMLRLFTGITLYSIVGEKGLTIVYTGGGKGKTTAALGLALRASGYGKRIIMIQFIKGSWHYGEMDSAKFLAPAFELVPAGKGFVGIIDDTSPREAHIRMAQKAIETSREKIQSGKYDIVILDEINYAVKMGLIKASDVLDLIKSKQDSMDLILTGNHAVDAVIQEADLVTEMKEVKHPYKKGIKAKRGIDF